MTAISFTEWQAGRRHVPDLSAEISPDIVTGPGFIYPGGYYVSDNDDPSFGGKYHLHIETTETFSDDLAALERRLFDYASPIDGGAS